MKHTYEFKLRMIHDQRDWEAIPVHDRQTVTAKAARKHAHKIASDSAIVEVRYNAAGSLQGHYVFGLFTHTRELHDRGILQ